jgi:hypothetical protein
VRYFTTGDDFRCSGFQPFVITYFKKLHIFVISFDRRDDDSPHPPAVAQTTLSSVTLCLSLSQVDRFRALRNENLLQLVNVLCACKPVYGLLRVNLPIVMLSMENGVQCLYQCYRFQLITNIETLPYLKITRPPLPSSIAHCSIPYCGNLRAGSKSVSGSVECRSAADWMFVLHMLI